MKKTKIAFCLRDMKIGGTESVCIRTLESLIKYEHLEISVITYVRIKEPLYINWFKNHPQVKLHSLYPCCWLGTDLVHFLPVKLIQHFCRDVYRWFKRTFANGFIFDKFDILIDYYQFAFDNELKKVNKPKISWWHSASTAFIGGNYVRYLSGYDKLVVLTDECEKDLSEKYPEYENKLIKIFNPIDVKDIQNKAKIGEKAKSKNYFVHVSRLCLGKDIETLMYAFNDFWLQNKKPDVDLIIVGDGNRRADFESIAKSLSASNKILFIGALSNPFGYMKKSMACILSSISEGFGMVIAEAAALKTLNISSDCSNGPREILLDGRAGLLFEPGNTKQLTDYMSDVWNKKADVKKMTELAYDSLDRFDADKIAKQIVELLGQYN